MRTIERNYVKHPHTAHFLMAFHTGTQGLPADRDDAEALKLEAAEDDDLLDLVPDGPADLRSEGQRKLMDDLIGQLADLDAEAARRARAFQDGITERGTWTPGREGNASEWISRMIGKVRELKAAAPKVAQPVQSVEIPAGRYAVKTDEIRCYTVDYGKAGTRWEGFLFLNRISSDDRFPIRNAGEKARILEAIRADVEASALLAALTLRICRGTMKNGQPCGRTLSDTKNPYFSQGYGPECGKGI